MIRLKERTLSKKALDGLANYQAKIKGKPTLTEQVSEAKRLWKPQSQIFEEIKQTLEQMCPGVVRCCYCEDSLARDIEHFRPKSLYPGLTFVWSNYLLACSACNTDAKNNRFGIFDTTGIAYEVALPSVIWDDEALLINPRYEDPLLFLQLEFESFLLDAVDTLNDKDKERANYTIEILALNRSELQTLRKKAFSNFIGWADSYHHYKLTNDLIQLQDHFNDLKQYNHLMVWEAMRRVYLGRDTRWDKLKNKHSALRNIDRIFERSPELLDITFSA